MNIPTNKKDGQHYSRKELLRRGWSKKNMDTYLTAKQRKGSTYYMASEVHAVEANSPISRSIRSRCEELEFAERLRSVSQINRIHAAKRLARRLDAALEAHCLTGDIALIAAIWHERFKEAMLNQEGRKHAEVFLFPKEILGQTERKMSNKARNAWFTQVAKAAWVMADNDPDSVFPTHYAAKTIAFVTQELDGLNTAGVNVDIETLLSIPVVKDTYPLKGSLYFYHLTYYLPFHISRDLSQLLAVDPKDEYPEARCMNRRFLVHVGGTNTGKTYQSLQRLMHAASGVYLAPLRLLALEVQETLLHQGVVCSMLTGEEEDILPNATHVSSTVEKLDIHQHYEVAVIDECQMVSDDQRGHAWTRAILGVQAEEIHLCVAPEGLDIVKRLIKELGEPYEVITHERKVPLSWQRGQISIQNAKAGDAFVAFSKRGVLQLAENLKRFGMPASIIYGALPYATRRQQMQRFLDGETKVLAATDAIGMGLNLPIRRVIFTEAEKFDGTVKRPLTEAEVRQIAGRAGRFGIYDKGFAAAGPMCEDLSPKLNAIPASTQTASLGFSDLVLKVDYPLADVLRVWNQIPVKPPYVRMDISRYIFIISVLQTELQLELSKEDLLRAGNIPFDERDEHLLKQFKDYAAAYASGAIALPPPEPLSRRLNDLELYHRQLDLYYSFSKTYQLNYDKEWLTAEKQLVADEINHLLVSELNKQFRTCKKCGAPLPLSCSFSVCRKCYLSRRKSEEGK